MRQRGFTLMELIIVMAVMGILLSIATVNWNRMQKKAIIENEVKTMHADLMEIRQQALYAKRSRSVVIAGQTFQAYSSAVITVPPVVTKQLRYPVTWSSSGVLTFDTQGLAPDTERTLCVVPTGSLAVINSAAVDSLVISQARINLGLRTGGVCDSASIDQK